MVEGLGGTYYTVQHNGERAQDIANKTGVSMEMLAAANSDITHGSQNLKDGMEVYIPRPARNFSPDAPRYQEQDNTQPPSNPLLPS